MIKKSVDTDVLLSEILHQLEEIKAKDVVLMDLRDIDSAVYTNCKRYNLIYKN